MKYRKKPVVIEAWQWCFGMHEEPDWIHAAIEIWPECGGILIEKPYLKGARISIATLEGVMIASPGDWIIQGIKGELYPCKPDIFKATYDPVEPPK